jgi:protein involved in polysaccharide export with SLBB domain
LLDVNLDAAQDSQANPLLQDGDYVQISSLPTQVANVVSLVGAVKSPGPYEFRSGMRISDVLSRDQLTADAYLEQAEVIRTDPVTYQTTVLQFSPRALFEGDRGSDYELQRLDQIVVASQVRPPSSVVVEGEVKRPGSYTLGSGERLSSVLKRAGGFTPNAFPQGIVLIRESVKRKQQAEVERIIAAERQRLAAHSAAIASGTAAIAAGASLTTYGSIAEQQVLAIRLQQLEAMASRLELGRVVVKMTSIEDLEGSEYDIRLEPNDKIFVPQPPQTVSIVGAVKNPTTLVYRPGLGLEDYLRQAGGVTADADKKDIYVIRANGSVEAAYLNFKNMDPGDTIVVPQKIEVKTPQIALWQAFASIIGSMALAVAGIAVIAR